MNKLFLAGIVLFMFGCGGGESDDGAFYGGVWRFSGIKFSDTCNTGDSTVFNTAITVNQDQGRLVATFGNPLIILTGTTNDKDGFSVSGTTPPYANGCQYGYAYVFQNASDGAADVGFSYTRQCGNQSCTVVYTGPGTRDSSRSTVVDESDDFNKLEGVFSQGLVVEKGVELEALVQDTLAETARAGR